MSAAAGNASRKRPRDDNVAPPVPFPAHLAVERPAATPKATKPRKAAVSTQQAAPNTPAQDHRTANGAAPAGGKALKRKLLSSSAARVLGNAQLGANKMRPDTVIAMFRECGVTCAKISMAPADLIKDQPESLIDALATEQLENREEHLDDPSSIVFDEDDYKNSLIMKADQALLQFLAKVVLQQYPLRALQLSTNIRPLELSHDVVVSSKVSPGPPSAVRRSELLRKSITDQLTSNVRP
jgi:hypothetical protein